MKFSMTGQEKLPFNTDDCLIEVTTLAGLILLCNIYEMLLFPFV